MRVGLVLAGDPPSHADLNLLQGMDVLVCADGAAKALMEEDMVPTCIVGDLDSLDETTYKWADALDIPFERHPAQKDETDGELALSRALSENPDELVIIGAHGGRTAMFLANLKLLRRAHAAGVNSVIVGRQETMRFLAPGEELEFGGRTGSTVNVLPIDADAVVSISGMSWNIEKQTLPQATARGVSNQVLEPVARVWVHDGLALVVIEAPAS